MLSSWAVPLLCETRLFRTEGQKSKIEARQKQMPLTPCARPTEKLLSATTRERLLQDVNAVLNPENIARPQLTDITGDIQAIFQANNLDRKQAVAIASDAKALAVEIQKAAAK